jgi:uncharacterized membrane protein/plastocyanin
MESKAKLFGHPVHPMLIVFPLGLFATAVIFDVVFLITGNLTFSIVSFWMISAGLVGGLLAAIPGVIDWLSIPDETRAKTIGMWHGIGNGVVVVLFGASWFIRMGEPEYAPGTMALIPSFVAFAIAIVTGWLGGELVDRMAVGVDGGAHLNSPNSLGDKPASHGAEFIGTDTGYYGHTRSFNRIKVDLKEHEIAIPATLPAGPTLFEVTNSGSKGHNFKLEGQGVEERFGYNLQPGQTDSIHVHLRPGKYKVYCPISDHEHRGMEIEIHVDRP